MPITPFENPSGEPKEPGTGEPPPITSKVSIAPAPPPAADSHEAPTSPDDERSGMLLIGEVFDRGKGGRYTVKERLGRGGMGEVYRAEYVAPDAKEVVQDLALKVLRTDALPRFARTFTDEVAVLSLLRHNHIAHYHDFFVENGRQVLVMEYVDGRSLHSILGLARRKGRTLSESTSLELLAQVADALACAHAAKDKAGRPLNIVHRDVSPGNIMVTSSGLAVLIDFGLAKVDLEDRTQPGSWVIDIPGKLPYMSPEQAQSLPLDGRSDLFSLCSILVEMLTGEPPFGRALKHATWEAIKNVTPRYVARVTRGLSRKVRAICRKALAPRPDKRFSGAREMAAAMLANLPRRGPDAVRDEIAALEDLPDAPPEEVEEVETDLRRLKRRRRALVAIGALACAAVACFFFWSAYSSRPPATPHEGKPIVNNPMKPEVTTPPVAETVAAAPPPIPPKRHVTKALTLAGICAATPACIPIFTETKAGDCYYVVQHELEGKTVPDVMYASLDESNPRGPCAGEWDIGYISRDEPCPVYDNDEIILRMAGDSPEEFPWYGPERNPMKKGQCGGRDWFWGRDGEKPSLLIGRTRVFDATGKYKSGFGHPPRDYVRRMTALITEIRTPDGQSVKVCGVLFGSDDKEGVPVFLSPEDGKPFGGSWGASYVKFFWPEETKQKSKKK